jgi:hypothetical protein
MARAKKVEETTKAVVPDDTKKGKDDVKYRHDFKSWDEYNKYTGKKA